MVKLKNVGKILVENAEPSTQSPDFAFSDDHILFKETPQIWHSVMTIYFLRKHDTNFFQKGNGHHLTMFLSDHDVNLRAGT